MTARASFAAALRTHQERLRLTHLQMAALLDVGETTYRSWLRGDPRRTPLAVTQEGVLARLARAVQQADTTAARRPPRR